MSTKGFPTRSLSMISPWDSPLPPVCSRGMVLLPCRFVRCSRLDRLLGDWWGRTRQPQVQLTGTIPSGYAIHSDKTSPKQVTAAAKDSIAISSSKLTSGNCSHRQGPPPLTLGQAGLAMVGFALAIARGFLGSSKNSAEAELRLNWLDRSPLLPFFAITTTLAMRGTGSSLSALARGAHWERSEPGVRQPFPRRPHRDTRDSARDEIRPAGLLEGECRECAWKPRIALISRLHIRSITGHLLPKVAFLSRIAI